MISVTIITKNEEANIERCLKSVLWADEIIVVDAFSTDRTCDIVRTIGARLLQRRWEGFAMQKEFAMLQASCEWVLSLDADEEVSKELRAEISSLLERNGEINGYEIPRKSYFLGKWIQHGGWYPGYQLRLFRKSKTRMNYRPVHEGFEVEGKVGRLHSPIHHYTYTSLHQYLEKMNHYSSLDVSNRFVNGKIVRWYHFFLNPLSSFLRMFVSLRGYRDGMHGFFLASFSALNVLATYAKGWEYQTAEARQMPLPPITDEELSVFKH
ncbi:MAG: glycosyltransferase family 2 protein [Bacteroidota bacterium]